jgi:hypothetical protein
MLFNHVLVNHPDAIIFYNKCLAYKMRDISSNILNKYIMKTTRSAMGIKKARQRKTAQGFSSLKS